MQVFNTYFSYNFKVLQFLIPLFFIATLNPLRANPKVNNEELSEEVTIRRTDYGVPHISAENIKAAGYGLGYVQMEDYGEKVADALLKARGEWTKYHEPKKEELNQAIDDDLANKIKYEKAVKTWAQLNQETQDIITGFVKGVNRYIKKHPDKFPDWVRPDFTVYDVHSSGIEDVPLQSTNKFLSHLKKKSNSKSNQTAGTSSDLNNDFEIDENSTLWTRLALNYEQPHTDAGSNSWAFAPERTTSGNPILVRNPHLSWKAGYYEVHLEVKNEFNFYGDFRIGGPLITIGGFNEHLGWSTTDNSSFMDEIYAFKADPERPDHYILDDTSIPIERKSITVEYKNGKGTALENREVLTTPYGPVIYRGNGKIYILRSAAADAFQGSEQYLNMMKAKSLDEWKEAMRLRGIITSNFTYADGDGNIFYVWNGAVPDLPQKWSGDSTAASVANSDQIWKNLIDWDDLPQLQNPEGGYVHNANDSFHFTNLNEVMDKEDYPDYLAERTFDLRSQSSYELIHNNKKFSLEDIVKLKSNMDMLLADRVKDDLIKAVRKSNPNDELNDALDLIEKWDNTVSRKSKGSVLFKTWWRHYVKKADSTYVKATPESVGFSATAEKLFKEVWSPENPVKTPMGLANNEQAIEAFEWAVKETKDKYGTWAIKWGEVHRAVTKDKNVAMGGCSGELGCFRVIWYSDTEIDGKQRKRVEGGDGWVMAVEFDKVPRAYSILAYGESQDEDSPYYFDQLELFADKKMKPVLYNEQEIKKHTIKEYKPGQ